MTRPVQTRRSGQIATLILLLAACTGKDPDPADTGSPDPGDPGPDSAEPDTSAPDDTAPDDPDPDPSDTDTADTSDPETGDPDPTDGDGDGVFTPEDCDDEDATTYPGAEEICADGAVNDCDATAEQAWADCTGERSLGEADAKLLGEAREDYAGRAVAGPGDVDGDGRADLLVGAYSADSSATDAGAAYLLLGPVSGVVDLATAPAKLVGEAEGDAAGWAVGRAGDRDRDGYDDLLIGAYREDAGGSGAGATYLVAGPVTGTVALSRADAKLIGAAAGDAAGFSIAGVADRTGDGAPELLIGAMAEDSGGDLAGAAYLVAGPVTGDLSLSRADARLVGEARGNYAGWTVADPGDVDGDGLGDLLVGTPWEGTTDASAGAVYLITGLVSGSVSLGDADAKLLGEGRTHFAGEAAAGAGDMDGDGYDDLLIGADGADTAGSSGGAAYLLHGPVSGVHTLSIAAWKLVAEADRVSLGGTLTGLDDLNGDGLREVAVGARGTDSSAGAAYLLVGPLSGTVAVSAATAVWRGEAASDLAGYAVTALGDTDGGGRDDLLVGAINESTTDYRAGAAYLLRGELY